MAEPELDRVREIALALPEVTERLSHHAPCFYVRDKRPLCPLHDAEFGGDRRVSIWCPAAPGLQDELLAVDPERFFRPTTSGGGVFSDWIGMYLDAAGGHDVDWGEVAGVLQDAFRTVAPKRLVAELDGR